MQPNCFQLYSITITTTTPMYNLKFTATFCFVSNGNYVLLYSCLVFFDSNILFHCDSSIYTTSDFILRSEMKLFPFLIVEAFNILSWSVISLYIVTMRSDGLLSVTQLFCIINWDDEPLQNSAQCSGGYWHRRIFDALVSQSNFFFCRLKRIGSKMWWYVVYRGWFRYTPFEKLFNKFFPKKEKKL